VAIQPTDGRPTLTPARVERPTLGALLRSGDVRALVTRASDLALAALVVSIVGMMIVPLPTFVLDLLISLNIAVAIVLLLISIYVSDALEVATFPTLLLLTTLFRLALEVSATRLILLHADGGDVIRAFGSFDTSGAPESTTDTLLRGRVTLFQPQRGFRSSWIRCCWRVS
jgi:hypothetical protein